MHMMKNTPSQCRSEAWSPIDVHQVAQMLEDAKCDDVSCFDLRQACEFADYFVVATARSHRHVFTAASAVIYQVLSATVAVIFCCLCAEPPLLIDCNPGRCAAMMYCPAYQHKL